MENETYKEYFINKKNKVSLAMWVLINNNVVTKNMYVGFMGIDFLFQLMIILCFYSQVGAVPEISQAVFSALDFKNPDQLAVISIIIASILIATLSVICILVFKEFPWSAYSERRFFYQIESFIIVVVRAPLLIITSLFILHNLWTFTEVENTYLKYISVICSLISAVILVLYSYLGSYLFNLCIPNEQLPWADTSHQPYLLQTLFKLLLVLTFKLRDVSSVLLYAMAVVTAAMCGYRLYLLLLKSHMFDDLVYQISILLDFGVIHLLVFFMLSAVNQGQDYYLLFVAAFMPVTCLSGLFIKERCKRVWLSQLMNDTMTTEGEQQLCFLYLIFLYTQETEDSWQQLIRLQQFHYTRCEPFFDSIERKMLVNLQNTRLQQKLQDIADGNGQQDEYFESEGNVGITDTYLNQNSMTDKQLKSYATGYSAMTAQKHAQLQSLIAFKAQKSGGGSSRRKSGQDLPQITGGPQFGTMGSRKGKSVDPELNAMAAAMEEDLKQGGGDGRIDQQDVTSGDQYGGGDDINTKSLDVDPRLSAITPYTKVSQRSGGMPPTFPKRRSKHGSFQKQADSIAIQKIHGKGGKDLIKTVGGGAAGGKTVLSNNISDIFNSSDGASGSSHSKLGKKGTFQAKRFDMEIKKEQLRKLVRHYFNTHLLDDSEVGFQLKLVKIYFTYKILKNPYLAHFLLFSYQEDDNGENNFIIANQRLLNQRYVDELISIRQQQVEETNRSLLGQVNLLGLLKVNQLLVEFDTSMERISSEILDFWENLVNSRETIQIFTQGIKISDQLKQVQNLLEEIQDKQSDSESKIYLQMAQFYSQVIFKTFESGQMLEKARVALQVKKLSKVSQERSGGDVGAGAGSSGDNQEKCLLMAHISLKKPMKITFINKAALKLLQYSMNEALLLAINNIMPRAISDMHSTFLDEFMSTGKTRMLKTKRELFLKQRSGNLVPVFTYLFVNNMSRKHMILMFEQNFAFKMFEEPYQNSPFGFFLATNEYRLAEVSQSFDKVIGVTNSHIAHLTEELDRTLHVDDLVKICSIESDVSSLTELHETNEAEVVFKIDNQRFTVTQDALMREEQQNSGTFNIYTQGQQPGLDSKETLGVNGKSELISPSINAAGHGKKMGLLLNDRRGSATHIDPSLLLRPVFIMKITNLAFLDGKFELKLISFRRKNSSYLKADGEYFTLNNLYKESSMIDSGAQKQLRGSQGMGTSDKDFMKDPNASTDEVMMGVLKDGNFNEDSLEENTYNEIMSQSSTGSFSSQSTTVSVFSAYTQQVNNDSTPKTLKFILNMVIVIICLMIVSSSLVLSISIENLTRAETSVQVCKHSFQAIDGMTTIRLLLRSLANIYQGYQLTKGEYMDDRSTYYEGLILDLNEQMRDDANYVAQMADGSLTKYSKNIQCGFLSSTGKEFAMSQSLSQGVNLLVGKVQDVIKSPDRIQVIGTSQLPFLNFGGLTSKNQSSYSVLQTYLAERDFYFVLNNTNGDLHYQLKTFGNAFSDQKLNEINNNMNYLTGMALGVISLITLSGFIVIPLFGKIQNRILELMKLFFAIDVEIKKTIIKRIEGFQNMYFKQGRNDKFSRVPSGLSLGESEEDAFSQLPSNEVAINPKKSLGGQIQKNGSLVDSNDRKNKYLMQSQKMKQAFGLGGKTSKKKQSSSNRKNLNKLNVHIVELDKIPEEPSAAGGNLNSSDDEDMGEEKKRNYKKDRLKKKAKAQKRKNSVRGKDIDSGKKSQKPGNNSGGKGGVSPSKKSSHHHHQSESAESYTGSDDESSSSRDDNKNENEKDKDHKKRQEEIKQAQIDAIINKEKEVILEFSKYTNRRKIIQGLFIVGLLSTMASYFLIKYLLSLSLFDKMKTSVVDLEVIFSRLACSQNVLNTYVESYFSTDLIQSTNPDFLSLNSQIENCMQIENKYQKNIIAAPISYLNGAKTYLNAIEQGLMCQGFANVSMTYEQCISISEQIRKQGLSTYYFNIMKSVKQMELDLTSAVKAQGGINKTFVAQQINSKIATYVDTLILIVLPAQTTIQDKALQSVSDYFNNQGTILSIIFAAYLTITIFMGVVFVFSMYQKLRKEMLASNKLLYIIDFESLQEAERQIILKFLLNY